ncbi:hypothetical protein OG618_37335 (plasmid) [Kitasatospora sp. NBC_01246]|uniref:hypothetical protein n=1 Tax=Kitasatospora sp. NBC_01246 TaxID=2903570 RepID=UPI002E2EE333|nr:hypothetical protein [Kitasatospora sp. NBC_01246]
MNTVTVLLTVHGEQHITLDSETLHHALAAGTAADLLEPHLDRLDVRSAVVRPDGTTLPLVPGAPLPGEDIRALAISLYEDVVDAKHSGPVDTAERLLRALGIDPAQIPLF